MSTLSQRLRDLRIGLFPDIETVNAVLDECIAQAEREAQAGELSDEMIKRILNANTYEDLSDSRQGGYVTSSDHDAYDMGMIAGLKYARDKGYPKPSQTTPVITHLNMDPNASPETIEAVEDVVQKAYSYKPPSQAIGEQTPVAKPNDWSNPEFRAKTFLERMLRLRADVSMWQGKCSVLRHENNRLRAKPSPEARDKAIHALATVIELWRDELVNEGYDTSTNFDKATQALSALRGQ